MELLVLFSERIQCSQGLKKRKKQGQFYVHELCCDGEQWWPSVTQRHFTVVEASENVPLIQQANTNLHITQMRSLDDRAEP